MATFHLVRHAIHAEVGQVLSGRSEIALSDDGRAQAERLGARYATLDIEAVLASPRRRAMQTAAPIAASRSAPVGIDDAFDEIDFGGWTGKRFSELSSDPAWTHWNEARAEVVPPGGESMAAATGRAVRRIAEIATRVAGAVVVVSHADVIRGVIAHTLGLSLDRVLGFDVDPASVSRLSVENWGARVLSVNEAWA
jgi:broad specificity phosphatase PhoE